MIEVLSHRNTNTCCELFTKLYNSSDYGIGCHQPTKRGLYMNLFVLHRPEVRLFLFDEEALMSMQ